MYPAMPYDFYTRVTARTATRSTPTCARVAPVGNAVDVNQLRFPFNVRDVDGGLARAVLHRGHVQA